jgi:hypothetical protein
MFHEPSPKIYSTTNIYNLSSLNTLESVYSRFVLQYRIKPRGSPPAGGLNRSLKWRFSRQATTLNGNLIIILL